MLIDGCKTFILRCRFCGRLREYEFNIFQVMARDKVEYKCKCGEINVLIKRQDNKGITAEIGCFNCGDKHYHKLSLKDMLKDDNMFYCLHGPELGFLGSKNIGNRILLEEQINVEGINIGKAGGDYFNNCNIMTKALNKLCALNERNKLYCDCGNSKINVEFFPDRIELKCLNCHSVSIIFAETEEDLSVLLKKDRIILKEHNISCIDSINEKNRDIEK